MDESVTKNGEAAAGSSQEGLAEQPDAGAPAPIDAEDPEMQKRRARRRRRQLIYCFCVTVVYYGLAVLYFTLSGGQKPCKSQSSNCTSDCTEPWNAADAIYFATVTMTTVGYGDLKPLPEQYAMTLVFLLIGVTMVLNEIAQALAPLYQRVEIFFYRVTESITRMFMGAKADSTMVDLDGDGLADYEEPAPAWLYYLKGIASWLAIWIASQLIFAVIYQVLEPEILPFGTAFYLCIVTALTVGYGDVTVSDTAGHRIFASFHILYSVSSLAALLNTVQVLSSERKIQIRKTTLLQRQLDPELIQSLDKDCNGLDKLEFVVGMLTKLEILHWDDVEPFLAQFDALDVDGSGRLDKNDLLRMVQQKQQKLEAVAAAKRAKTHGADGPRLVANAPGEEPPDDERTQVTSFDEEIEAVEKACGSCGAGTLASDSTTYRGIGARNRELAAAGVAPNTSAGLHRGDHARRRLFSFFGGGTFAIGGDRTARGGRHMRGKVAPNN